jgi:hypothetical protein
MRRVGFAACTAIASASGQDTSAALGDFQVGAPSREDGSEPLLCADATTEVGQHASLRWFNLWIGTVGYEPANLSDALALGWWHRSERVRLPTQSLDQSRDFCRDSHARLASSR